MIGLIMQRRKLEYRRTEVDGSFTYIGGRDDDPGNLSDVRATIYALTLHLRDRDDTFFYKQITGSVDPLSFNLNFGAGTDMFTHNVPITWPSNTVGLP